MAGGLLHSGLVAPHHLTHHPPSQLQVHATSSPTESWRLGQQRLVYLPVFRLQPVGSREQGSRLRDSVVKEPRRPHRAAPERQPVRHSQLGRLWLNEGRRILVKRDGVLKWTSSKSHGHAKHAHVVRCRPAVQTSRSHRPYLDPLRYLARSQLHLQVKVESRQRNDGLRADG